MMRVGQGYDAHVWSEDDRPLVIGGVYFAGFRGLKGHSDADVVTHAVIDAILGALGMGDIGQIFPDTDPENEAASSIEMLSEVKKSDQDLLGHLMMVVKKVAEQMDVQDAFNVVINNGEKAGQTVFHLHIHLLAGANFSDLFPG